MKTARDIFYFVDDIMAVTGLSRSKSYKIIATLNAELKKQGYLIIPGRISKIYFHERFYGVSKVEQ